MNAGEIDELVDVVDYEAPGTSRFSTLVSVLLAVVSVLGAILAWRVAVASSNASSADTRGLLTEVDRADVNLQSAITVFGHETAYASYQTNTALATAFALLGPDYQAASAAFMSAADGNLDFVPRGFVDREGKYAVATDLGTLRADLAVERDTNPDPKYARADSARLKSFWLLGDLIWFSGALLALTLADAIRQPVRYFFLMAGIAVLLTGSLAAILIELLIP